MAALPALATRIVQLERDAAAKEHLELVLDRRVVVDSDSEIRDPTRETIEAYDDAFAPVALRLPHLQSAAVDWEHRSQAEVARTLSNWAGRDVDLRNCTRDIFFQHAESPLPELFSAFAREHNLYWIDFGADLAARCPRPAVPSQPIPYSSHLNPSEIFSVSLSLLQGDCDGYQVFGLAPHGEWTKRGVQNRDVLHEVAGKSFCKPGWQEALARSMPGDLVIRCRDQLIRL